mmetsp:Transcript_29781/g.83206  ORF Transcript_29781/g.83206 Transcript_29781/m.83206 type:complete len:205 (+) Transcript_29781:534-1148(+)
MSLSPTETSTTRLPGSFRGSNEKRTPLTQGKRPSSAGYFDTPLLRASSRCSADNSTTHSGSAIGSRLQKSLIVRMPTGRMRSARRVPLLRRATSTLVPRRMRSAIRSDTFVSSVRIMRKRASNGQRRRPMGLAIFLVTDAEKFCTIFPHSGSGGKSLGTEIISHVNWGRVWSEGKFTVILANARKSVPELRTNTPLSRFVISSW